MMLSRSATAGFLLAIALSSLVRTGSAQWKAVPLIKSGQQLSEPTCLAVAPDGRIFITERVTGKIRIYDANRGGLLKTEFAKIANLDKRQERGLLGITLHPDFPTKPYVYVFHDYQSGTKSLGQLVRYTAVGDTGKSPKVLISGIGQEWSHNGGYLQFGPDKKLYMVIGDLWVPANSQDKTVTNWNGKMHRLNDDASIPSDNPYGKTSPQFCRGIRNSFGFTFHPFTKELYESENGPTTNDELNIMKAGKNYGWPFEIGNQNKPGYEKPIRIWTPTIGPVGVEFYRGKVYPAQYHQTLWLCDYKNNKLRILTLGGNPADTVVKTEDSPLVRWPVDVKMGIDGKMYVTSHFGFQFFRIDWVGTQPKLPDLVHMGTAKIGNRTMLTQRGKKGAFMVRMFGTKTNPVQTPWGIASILAFHIEAMGPAGNDGILTTQLDWPSVPSLKGVKLSMQSLELTTSFVGRFTNRVDLVIQ